jgi:hypothetical protein
MNTVYVTAVMTNLGCGPEIDVWYVRPSNLAGLNVEAKTDLLEESGRLDSKDFSIDLVTRVRCRAAP